MQRIHRPDDFDGEPCSKAEELALWLFIFALLGLLISIARLIWSIRSALTGA